MKLITVLKRSISMLLTLCILLGVCVLVQAEPQNVGAMESASDNTSETEPTDTVPTDEELIEKYSIADDWARPALLFAVKKGLLSGKEDNNLAPSEPASRAELAAIFMSLFQTKTEASLEGYTDVDPGKWYCTSLARAVAAGLITGTSKTTLSPDAPVTREQAFTLFARAFGVTTDSSFRIYSFSDGQSVSGWAAASVAAMAEAGYISGSNGRVEPKNTVTRQELAQIFYNILTDITKELPAEFTGTLAAAAEAVAPDTDINGDLILCGESETVTLEGLTVTGRLVIQGCGPVSLMLNDCSVKELVLCRPTTLYSKDGIETVTVLGSPSTLNGNYLEVYLRANTLINGTVNDLTVFSGSATLSSEAQAESLNIAASAVGCAVTIDGLAAAVNVYAKRATVNGTGSIGLLTVTQNDSVINCPFDKKVTQLDMGLKSVSLSRTDSSVPSEASPKATISISFSGGTDTRTCGLLWYVNGNPIDWTEDLQFSPNGTASCEIDFTPYMQTSVSVEVSVRLVYRNEVTLQSFPVKLDSALYRQAKEIRTLDVPATLRYDVAFYSRYGHTYLRTLSAGTVVYHKEYTTSEGRIKLKDGTEGWVFRYSYSIIPGDYYVTWDYSKEVKELYVNEIRPLSSKTNYLIWVNLYTQKANIFTGSQGRWKLLKVCPIASGANTMVTVDQLTEIRYKTKAWYFSSSGDYVHHVSVIDYAGRAFHSRLYWTSNGSLKDGTMGKPVSHGCMRMSDEDCTFIYNSVPTGTAVLVY